MAITTEQVKQLRQETGVGIMDCKRALEEANGDMEEAKQALREEGMEIEQAARTGAMRRQTQIRRRTSRLLHPPRR